ncbi:hypothetical protein CIL03_00720 [Virgibacillus indicus]|uniref:GGDEF domain-containing protein n=1 Tax=Virgibacillus indicus TaxID=2024554 RepID=A0A265NEI6_9BACI|nr:diguanylate cyclase [Virgibacillus indicus]OZU89696.1 hypothetical protein CIL03_00720 [Virgibacillus indicus]
MKREIELNITLKETYFELLANTVSYSYEEILTKVAASIQQIMDAPYVAFYLYDSWNKTYQLITDAMDKTIYDSKQMQTGKISGESFEFIKNTDAYTSSSVIELDTNDVKGMLVITWKEESSNQSQLFSGIIKTETEKLLDIISQNNKNEAEASNHRTLYDFTKKLFSLNSRSTILQEIINGLENRYPEFTFDILLSQDSEADHTLPVKTIKYSDDATKQVSTQAFLSGLVQIEDRVNEKNTCVYAPLTGRQAVYGVVKITAPKLIAFTELEIAFIRQFAEIAGKAIENATLYQHSEHLVADLKLINELTQKLNSNLQLSEITKLVRNQILNICHASQVGFIYFNEASNREYNILTGSTAYFTTAEGHSFAEHLHRNNQVEPLFSGNYKMNGTFSYQSVMVIPMRHSGENYGLIAIMHEEAYFFTFEIYKLMQSLVQHSALSIMNTILKEKLEMSVITDYLTQLYTREYLEEKINYHMQTDENGILILLDIDDFKQINDTFGHKTGDQVLTQISSIIKEHTDTEGVAARWGGEELAIYLPNADDLVGYQLARLICELVKDNTDPGVTLSCGVSSWNSQMPDSADQLFVRTDQALYDAKNSGKNNIVLSR